MGLARTWSVALRGVSGELVEVECDLSQGVPGVAMVGLPDTAVREARDRVRAALLNTGERWPAQRIAFNLSPASLPKHGSGFDLALAVAVLGADGRVPTDEIADVVFVGELGLDGRVRPLRGVLPAVLAAARAGHKRVVVPAANHAEAALVRGVDVVGVGQLSDLVGYLLGELELRDQPEPVERVPLRDDPDLSEVVGQAAGRRAVEVAAAGGHQLFLVGPPGGGKTMLAERLPGLLPPLDEPAALEVTAIHSLAGTLPAASPLLTRPPYEAPHHTASTSALVGGGSGLARPGAISRAHHGVLFLDEAPEFSPRVLDALRQPLESGEVVLQRAAGTATYPARFQLVLAANPCPCSSAAGDQMCVCPAMVRRRYLARLSGPLLDRIDLQVRLMPVGRGELLGEFSAGESSATVAARVVHARSAAGERWGEAGVCRNADVRGSLLQGRWRLGRPSLLLLERALERGALSARGLNRVVRVAWTIADLDGATTPGPAEISEALGMRLRGEGVA